MTDGAGAELTRLLGAFGAPPSSVISLNEPTSAAHLNYLDLVKDSAPAVDAVVELAGRSVLYVVRGPRDPGEIRALQHMLMQRGAADHLAVLEPGVLAIYPVVTVSKDESKPIRQWNERDFGSGSIIPELAWRRGADDNAPGSAQKLHERLLKLLEATTNAIIDLGVGAQDALSLVGRVLFVRFLIDRDILSDPHIKTIGSSSPRLSDVMAEPKRVEETSAWLHRTFNGNFLLLGEATTPEGEELSWPGFWSRLGKRGPGVCKELSKLLHKTDEKGQYSFAWDTLDFGHIPVGLLSQVYEAWYHEHASDAAKRDSVWYTPRSIAEYLTAEAFWGLPDDKRAYARVLDPAVGAGVFLVAAYREIAGARWRLTGARPDKKALRDILYKQLVGFDVNEAALRLAALSLYLTALELDPDPQLSQSLRFQDLRQNGVLLDVRSPSDLAPAKPDLPPLGSLGPHISKGHDEDDGYDVVLGNPPWTAWASETSRDPAVHELRRTVERVLDGVVQERLADPLATFEMVDNNPDLAFVWRAMQWAKPKTGIIALAIHARLLFKTTETATKARRALFRAMTVTGILNGSALSQTKVWPNQEAPFCLLFALNRPSRLGEGFRFVSPLVDESLNSRGHIRIDPHAVHPVFPELIEERPWLLKTLFRGTSLDVSIVERLLSAATGTLDGMGLVSTRGYQEGGRVKKPAPHLVGLPKFGSEDCKKLETARLETAGLPEFGTAERVSEPRNKKGKLMAFQGPLVLYPEAPRHDLVTPRALWCETGLAFDNSFYGFSAASHPNGDLLSRYVLIILNSRVTLHYALMTSSMLGVGRKRLDLGDLRSLPVPKLDDLPPSLRAQVRELSEVILNAPKLPDDDIDRLVGQIYGLSRQDLQVIKDAVSTALPFTGCRELAQRMPKPEEIQTYLGVAEGILASVLYHAGRSVKVKRYRYVESEPWIWLLIRTQPTDRSTSLTPHAYLEDALLKRSLLVDAEKLAFEGGSSRIVVRGRRMGTLLLGVFSQYRYFTPTQARLLALDLLGDASHEAWLRGVER